jgi:hypothetical protein
MLMLTAGAWILIFVCVLSNAGAPAKYGRLSLPVHGAIRCLPEGLISVTARGYGKKGTQFLVYTHKKYRYGVRVTGVVVFLRGLLLVANVVTGNTIQ